MKAVGPFVQELQVGHVGLEWQVPVSRWTSGQGVRVGLLFPSWVGRPGTSLLAQRTGMPGHYLAVQGTGLARHLSTGSIL